MSELEERMWKLWTLLPESGSLVDFDYLDRLFVEHFPESKTGTITLAEVEEITAQIEDENG